MPIPCQKHLFRLDPGIHYLNGAYMSPSLRSVEEAGIRALSLKRSPNRIAPGDFFSGPEQLRALFARLVNAPSPEAVALIPAASYGMAIVAKNLKAEKGRKIIVAGAQFPSNVYPWRTLAKDRDLALQTVEMPPEPEGRALRWNEALLAAIDERTALVAIGHIHWADGTIFDLEKISEKVRRCGGLLVVDGTQSVGAMPMDVQKFKPDALVCAGYKWLMGPYSLGYAWFGPAFLDGEPVEENWANRLGSEDFARLVDYQDHYSPGARRFDVGERSNFVLLPMAGAALEQLLAWGPVNIQAYCRALTADAAQSWAARGFRTEDPDRRAAHLFGIQLPPRVDAGTVQQKLREHHIFASVRGEFVRIAPNVYNDAEDMAALTAVLETL